MVLIQDLPLSLIFLMKGCWGSRQWFEMLNESIHVSYCYQTHGFSSVGMMKCLLPVRSFHHEIASQLVLWRDLIASMLLERHLSDAVQTFHVEEKVKLHCQMTQEHDYCSTILLHPDSLVRWSWTLCNQHFVIFQSRLQDFSLWSATILLQAFVSTMTQQFMMVLQTCFLTDVSSWDSVVELQCWTYRVPSEIVRHWS